MLRITKALTDEHRIRVLMALRSGELCACQITELFALAPSTMSKHLSVLYQAGLVESRKEGRWIYSRLADGQAPAGVKRALGWVTGAAAGKERVREDRTKL